MIQEILCPSIGNKTAFSMLTFREMKLHLIYTPQRELRKDKKVKSKGLTKARTVSRSLPHCGKRQQETQEGASTSFTKFHLDMNWISFDSNTCNARFEGARVKGSNRVEFDSTRRKFEYLHQLVHTHWCLESLFGFDYIGCEFESSRW